MLKRRIDQIAETPSLLGKSIEYTDEYRLAVQSSHRSPLDAIRLCH